jgi:hypothetical protein
MEKKNPNFWQNNAKFPNSRGMGHIPKMVKKSPVILKLYDSTLGKSLIILCIFVVFK